MINNMHCWKENRIFIIQQRRVKTGSQCKISPDGRVVMGVVDATSLIMRDPLKKCGFIKSSPNTCKNSVK